MVLSKQYRTEGNFSWENLEAAQNRLNELRSWADLRHQPSTEAMTDELDSLFKETREGMLASMQEDLDSPAALIVLGNLVNYMLNIAIPGTEGDYTDGFLGFVDDLLGLSLSKRPDITDEQKDLIKKREAARAAKDFNRSDELRKQLEEQGIAVRDTAYGPQWSRL